MALPLFQEALLVNIQSVFHFIQNLLLINQPYLTWELQTNKASPEYDPGSENICVSMLYWGSKNTKIHLSLQYILLQSQDRATHFESHLLHHALPHQDLHPWRNALLKDVHKVWDSQHSSMHQKLWSWVPNGICPVKSLYGRLR